MMLEVDWVYVGSACMAPPHTSEPWSAVKHSVKNGSATDKVHTE